MHHPHDDDLTGIIVYVIDNAPIANAQAVLTDRRMVQPTTTGSTGVILELLYRRRTRAKTSPGSRPSCFSTRRLAITTWYSVVMRFPLGNVIVEGSPRTGPVISSRLGYLSDMIGIGEQCKLF